MVRPNSKEKEKGKGEEQQEEVPMVKTTIRLPKPLMKQVKQYALDNDLNVTLVIEKAINDLLKIEKDLMNKDKSQR